jgi:hypothetical protein
VHGSSLWLNSSEQEFFSIQVRSNAIQRRPIHRFRPSDGSEGLREERAARFANNRTERRASRADQQEPVALLFALSHRVLFSWQREITRWFDFRCVRTANSEVSVVLDAAERSYSNWQSVQRHRFLDFRHNWLTVNPGDSRSFQSDGSSVPFGAGLA